MTAGEKFTGYAGLEPFVLKDEKTHLQVYQFEPRPLEDDEVEIKVSACGICGSDVHQLTNGWKRATYPLIAGHEFIGQITAVGSQVRDRYVGQRVGVSPICRSCGDCVECNSAHGQLCPSKVTTYNGNYKGKTTYGGYSDRVRVQGTWAIPIPDNISDQEGAPLLCAGITTFLPFKHHNIDANTSVGIIGIGGLGHLAIQWARAKKCAQILAISTSTRKSQDAYALGATDFVVLDKDGQFDSKYALSVDVLLVCGSGKSTNWGKLAELVKTRGKIVLIDLPDEPISMPAGALSYRHISLVGTFVGSNVDLEEMLAFASETGVRPWIQTVENTLEGVNGGIKDLIQGKAHYRIVIGGRQ
ncbi:alcohol dehydrogenase-like protein [Gilbertella persicaria]|uniref:alcohol dehydrogenase-like protein n=1 Tax=Gilbertella persicaria TaxID=101096 RepID=UPI002220BCB8|nr:alcohol dehydrogenase-like protein [Gilbertella persicaria]KAI8080224.1 alcohol dehydrogenase-like protein [Gilbertella persicaria]